ncbi:MAG: type II 3-dehydroquinate dehydratase [Rhizobacter sp.]|nr:type II 3-dehydroquinate dehydratase [Rhizobacter sp.]
MAKILLLNGPNLNLLGTREPQTYGHDTLADVEAMVAKIGAGRSVVIECFQSNHEGALIDRIHAAGLDGTGHIVITPGGLTHTSVALRDALAGVAVPFFEVHVSNVHKRESFRHHSFLSEIAAGVIVGFGVSGYAMAVNAAIDRLTAA